MSRTLLRVLDVGMSYDRHEVFANVSFEVNEGERTAIVGANGVGKSTLLQLIWGALAPVSGSVQFALPTIAVGYLPQRLHFPAATTPRRHLTEEHTRLGRAARFTVEEALGRFDFAGSDADLPVTSLSGGQKTRLALAALWLWQPDLLLLDEPTNHLDQEGLAWLEEMVRAYPHTVLVVSHDRYFLDQVVTRVLELTPRGITSYSGNYSAYQQRKEEVRRQQWRQYEQQQQRLRHLEESIARQMRWFKSAHHEAGQHDFYRSRAKKSAKRAKATVRRLEREKQTAIEKPRPAEGINFEFADDARHGRRLFLADRLGKAFDRVLFREASFAIMCGDKVGIVGPNGAGKTTLIRMLLGLEPPSWGNLWRSPSLKAGYLEQEMASMEQQQTLAESLLSTVQPTPESRQRVYALLASFLFRQEDWDKPLAGLSEGEKRRVALLRLLLGEYNVLLLDEPTNHFDLPGREKLEEALQAYLGTLIISSHDRYLLQRVCRSILAIEDNTVRLYPGGWKAYQQRRTAGSGSGEVGPDAEVDEGERLLLEHRLALLGAELAQPHEPEELTRLQQAYVELQRRLTIGRN